MNFILRKIIICILIFSAEFVFAQNTTLIGRVIDTYSGEAISFANIKIDGKPTAIADSLGFFKTSLAAGSHRVVITKTGFKYYERQIRIGYDERLNMSFEMEVAVNELDRVVVSASRQEKKLAKETVSITSIQPELIANTNSNTLSDVLNRVPGISVIEGQAIIRGSVGWSYNVGSRVMVLLDDMPLMGPDVGDVQWDLLPIEAAENIEVIKGPSSVLYGSSASSGTVSLRTGWATNKPKTKIQVYQGITDNPSRAHTAWWDRTSQPFNTGMFFSHKQKFGNMDFVWSGNLDANRSYIEQNDNFRARTYLKTRYRFQSIPGLTAGVNGNLLFKKGGRFFLWADADTNSLRPFSGSTGQDFYRVWSFDPHINYTKADKYTLALRMRHYNITRFVDTVAFPGENDAVANIQAMDINFQKQWLKGLSTTSGVYITRLWAVGNVYPGNYTGYTAAAFTQVEYQYRKWNTSAGLRYEFNALGPIEESPGPLFRAGVNYQAAKRTFIRTTYGEGFRFATIGERFVSDQVSGLSVLPSPDLRSETGWYTEVGIKQGFKIGSFNGSADFAFFWQDYRDLIEFRFSQWKKDTSYLDQTVTPPRYVVIPGQFGFKAINFDHTRAAGFEISLEGDGRIGEIGIRTLCGYTYTLPIDLNNSPDMQSFGSYMSNLFRSMNGLDDAMQTAILPYRNRHLVKADIEMSYRKYIIGYGSFYYSAYDKIDAPLYTIIPGIRSFFERTGKGDWVHNIRVGYNINSQVTIAFLANNILNREYAIRPARIDQPRNFNVQLRMSF